MHEDMRGGRFGATFMSSLLSRFISSPRRPRPLPSYLLPPAADPPVSEDAGAHRRGRHRHLRVGCGLGGLLIGAY